ncbi:NAD(+)/NADH kinase [Chthoniobacter flavus]|uniref:NAD(+)/NADH kinase n=1 Tax=Chthoniobacter flavus TaxID=191863 RepID=UPI00104FCCE8|nr:NAD(+)/NADH kinase [Chthoniobacter flavus]
MNSPANPSHAVPAKIGSVVVFINRTKTDSQRIAVALKAFLDRKKIRQEWVETLPPQRNLFRKMGDLRESKADMVIAVGGDGTLLQAAHRFRGSPVPILGVNIGYLGFITSVTSEGIRRQLSRVLNGDFVVSERTAIEVLISGEKKAVAGWALNDAIITRGSNPHMISVNASIGKRRLTKYRCDGLIIATPTGSTAYSLAAGGPIISPECSVLTVTPICPQALTNRSVVIDSTEPIEIRLDRASGPAELQVDGMRIAKLENTHTITVKTASAPVPIAFLPEINYYDVLAEKLQWRGDGLSKPKYGHS